MTHEVAFLVRHRFKRAKTVYRDGLALLKEGSLESAVNRFYYAAFYAARALLALKGLDSSKHSGVISLFNRCFVKPGFISKPVARALTRSYERRLDSDYEDFVAMTSSEVSQTAAEVQNFISVCEQYFKAKSK